MTPEEHRSLNEFLEMSKTTPKDLSERHEKQAAETRKISNHAVDLGERACKMAEEWQSMANIRLAEILRLHLGIEQLTKRMQYYIEKPVPVDCQDGAEMRMTAILRELLATAQKLIEPPKTTLKEKP